MKDTKKVQILSTLVLILSLTVFILIKILKPLADLAIRLTGILMLIGIALVSYTTVKLRKENKSKKK